MDIWILYYEMRGMVGMGEWGRDCRKLMSVYCRYDVFVGYEWYAWSARKYRTVLDAVSSALFTIRCTRSSHSLDYYTVRVLGQIYSNIRNIPNVFLTRHRADIDID